MTHTCDYCFKELSSKQSLQRHQNTCKKYKDFEIENRRQQNQLEQQHKELEQQHKELEQQLEQQRKEYEQQLKQQLEQQRKEYEQQLQTKDKEIQMIKQQLVEFKTQLFEIARQPKQVTNHNNQNTQTTNNRILNITNNLVPMDLTDEQIREIVKNNYTRNVFLGGPDSIVEMTASRLLTDQDTGKFRIVCTDTSRNVFYYQDCDENLIKDIGMKDIHKKIQKPLVEATSSHYKKIDEENSMNDDKLSELLIENMSFIDHELPNRLKRNLQLPINIQE
jgi:hypothetical protein